MNPTAVVRPLPGPGLAARAGDLLMVCADAGDGVEELLGLVTEVAAAGGDGSVLVRRVAALLAADFNGLIDYEQLGRDALLSIPTPDHYLPLLYVIGAWRQSDPITFPVEGIDGGSVSMLAVQAGR